VQLATPGIIIQLHLITNTNSGIVIVFYFIFILLTVDTDLYSQHTDYHHSSPLHDVLLQTVFLSSSC